MDQHTSKSDLELYSLFKTLSECPHLSVDNAPYRAEASQRTRGVT